MSSDEGEVGRFEENLFASEAEVSGSDEDGARHHQSNSGQNGIMSGSGQEDKDNDSKKKDKAKSKVKRPTGKRIGLSEDILCGKNGLIKLEETFKDFKFEGRGREKQDLDRLLQKIELWVHVLHPRNPFEQTLERIEWLGLKKKSVKTHVKKIRMGLISNIDPVDDNNLPDFVSDEEGDDGEVNKEASLTETNNDGLEKMEHAQPILIQRQIRHFGFDDSEDEDDLLLASILDPSAETLPTTNEVGPETGSSATAPASASTVEDVNMEIDIFDSVQPDVPLPTSDRRKLNSEESIQGELQIDQARPRNSNTINSDEIEDMLLDEESQMISSNDVAKSIPPISVDKNVILVDDDEFDRLMADVGM